jgi:hypothetical protein
MPFLISLGTIGNIMSILVLSRREMYKATTTVYLIALECADILVLYTGPFIKWLSQTAHIVVRNLSNIGCKVNSFLAYSTIQYSAWVLCLVAVERTVSVFLPHKYKVLSTKRLALVLLLILAFVICMLNQHFFWTVGLTENDLSEGICYPKEQFATFVMFVWPWIHLFVACLIPSAIMVVCNTSIIMKLVHMSKNNVGLDSESARLTKKNILLMCLCLVFLVTQLPIHIWVLVQQWKNYHGLNPPETEAINSIFWAIIQLICYSNNAVNFLLYCFSGPRFRRELRLLCGCTNPPTPQQTTQAAVNVQVSPMPGSHQLEPRPALNRGLQLQTRHIFQVVPATGASSQTMETPVSASRNVAWT